ncbi:MAG: hypothetical protein HEP71_26465 [Roseivirga sp.]|nr:hypothetical protein [Roseivirga sp.]
MTFEESYLRDLVDGFAVSDVFPYSTGNSRKIEEFLCQLVGRLGDIGSLSIEADFNNYGSGYASYVPLNISKKDKSDITKEHHENGVSLTTNGLMVYLSRVAPVVVYGAGHWIKTYMNGKETGGGAHFLEPDILESLPSEVWEQELKRIKTTLTEFGFSIPPRGTLARNLSFEIEIPTLLGETPYRVFDCFFYWMD